MRLSEIRGRRVFEVMAELVDPIHNIASDADFTDALKGGELGDKLKQAVPSLMKTHQDDLVAIMASLEGTTPDEYVESLDFPKFIADVYSVITDKELIAFFTSFDAIEGLSGSR